MYESDPSVSKAQVATHFGVSKGVVDRYSLEEGWKKAENTAAMTAEAHRLADRVSTAIEPLVLHPTPEAMADVQRTVTRDEGAERRAQIVDRHRDEWKVVRGLSAEALKGRDFERAKLAKITAETIKLLQDGERRAWGLDQGEGNTTVVIDRGSND
jgi:hypothetical protein